METEKMIDDMPNFSFRVIDNKTGKEADAYNIALKEDWAKGLIYCDMEGFAIGEEGNLILLDECGNLAYCPSGRFTVIPKDAVVLTREDYDCLVEWQSDTEEIIKCKIKPLENEIYELKKKLKQARKETAMEILKEVNEFFRPFDKKSPISLDLLLTKLETIVKKFGVEIEG